MFEDIVNFVNNEQGSLPLPVAITSFPFPEREDKSGTSPLRNERTKAS